MKLSLFILFFQFCLVPAYNMAKELRESALHSPVGSVIYKLDSGGIEEKSEKVNILINETTEKIQFHSNNYHNPKSYFNNKYYIEKKFIKDNSAFIFINRKNKEQIKNALMVKLMLDELDEEFYTGKAFVSKAHYIYEDNIRNDIDSLLTMNNALYEIMNTNYTFELLILILLLYAAAKIISLSVNELYQYRDCKYLLTKKKNHYLKYLYINDKNRNGKILLYIIIILFYFFGFDSIMYALMIIQCSSDIFEFFIGKLKETSNNNYFNNAVTDIEFYLNNKDSGLLDKNYLCEKLINDEFKIIKNSRNSKKVQTSVDSIENLIKDPDLITDDMLLDTLDKVCRVFYIL